MNERELFEKNDMTLLHSWFEEGSIPTNKDEFVLPQTYRSGQLDLWSKTINVICSGDDDQRQSLYYEIEKSDMPQDSKLWWLSILSIALDAPLEHMEQLASGNKHMPTEISSQCIEVAARILADYAAGQERHRRYMERVKEEKELHELENIAEERRKEKETAEDDLKRHREQGNRG